jgi:hypothetical protein
MHFSHGRILRRAEGVGYSREIHPSRLSRVQTMAYRDAHGSDMRVADWQTIERRLGASYRLLKQAIATVAR